MSLAVRYQGDPSKEYRETPYVYFGGWANAGSGLQVDAGLVFNEEELDIPIGSRAESWSLFLSHWSPPSDAYSFRFAAGQDVFLEFYVPEDNKVAVAATGTYARQALSGVNQGTTVYVKDLDGWTKSGQGNILKRVTSIAQREGPGYVQDLSSGSFINSVVWNGVRVGGSKGTTAAWQSGQTNPIGGICNYPNSTVVDVFPGPDMVFNYEQISIHLN
jgi:hypothetical protein